MFNVNLNATKPPNFIKFNLMNFSVKNIRRDVSFTCSKWVLNADVNGAGASGELERKILGGAVRGFFNSLEWNWNSTTQLRSSAAHIMSRPARICVVCLHKCTQHGDFFFLFVCF